MEKAYEKNGAKLISRNIDKITSIDVKEILHNASISIINYLVRIGLICDEVIIDQPSLDSLFCDYSALAQQFASCLRPPPLQTPRLIAPGFGYDTDTAVKKGHLCYTQNGFQIHAATRVNPLDRNGLERLVGYAARPAISEQKLRIEGDQVVYPLKRPWSDGRAHITYQPMPFLRRLASLIPLPRGHLVRHAGVFAPASPMRKLIVPNPTAKKVFRPGSKDLTLEKEKDRRKVKNHSWARLLARVFECDVGRCVRCGDDMIIMGAIQKHSEAERYLRHVKLWDSTGPPSFKSNSTPDEPFYLKIITD